MTKDSASESPPIDEVLAYWGIYNMDTNKELEELGAKLKTFGLCETKPYISRDGVTALTKEEALLEALRYATENYRHCAEIIAKAPESAVQSP